MTKLIIANFDVRHHVTSENIELQDGLAAAGWKLAGFGFDSDNCVDVPTLLDRHKPEIVLVMPREDLDASSAGCFDKRCSPNNIEALSRHPSFKIQVVKDSAHGDDRREAWCKQIGADALLLYYHPQSMIAMSPWIGQYPLIRTYHSIDRKVAMEPAQQNTKRLRGIVSGAVNARVYPTRTMAVDNAANLGIDVLKHPGYKGRVCHSNNYLCQLAGYKVHVATASRFGFSLRKIFESVAVGCTPVTDLPAWDLLPEIDDVLVRVNQGCSLEALKEAIDCAAKNWNYERAMTFAQKAWDYYDWRISGQRLDAAIVERASCSTQTPS